MKYLTTIAAALIAVAYTAAPAMAQPRERGPERDRPGGPNPERIQRLLEEFDADGDGQLSDEERANARQTMQQRRGERGDARGEGRGQGRDEARRGPGREEAREEAREGRGPEGRGPQGRRGQGPPEGRRGYGGPPEGRRGPGGPPAGLARSSNFIDPRVLFDQFDVDDDDQLSREEYLSLSIEVQKIRSEQRFTQVGMRRARGPQAGPQAGAGRTEFRPRREGPPRDGQRDEQRDGARPGRRPPRGEDGDRPQRRPRPALEQSADEPATYEPATVVAVEPAV